MAVLARHALQVNFLATVFAAMCAGRYLRCIRVDKFIAFLTDKERTS